MLSFLHSFSPVPSFPAYTGPYPVGTRELEIPISELPSLPPPPPPDPSITTISGRIFYPCENPSPGINTNLVYWLPEPQSEYFAAYARFLLASPWLASLLSYFPLIRPLFYTPIPALSHAPLLPPPPTSTSTPARWPVLIFSHGLTGSKNAYSLLLTSLASHGLVVFALEHRDGSAPVSFIRTQKGSFGDAKRVEARRFGFRGGKEVDEGRDRQLGVRCWEMAGAWEVVRKVEGGGGVVNLAEGEDGDEDEDGDVGAGLEGFHGRLDVSTPGRVVWAGHSFGATTVVQFVKSVFYADSTLLGAPSPALKQQITPASPTVFLDLWAQPLRSTCTWALWEKPLPCCSNAVTTTSASASTSSAPLAILSESFFSWKANLEDTIRLISPPATVSTTTSSSSNGTRARPHIFYPLHSAHLSQSDFGPLFPWFTRWVFKAEDPLRTIVLNVRAILETLRRAGLAVADTSKEDMEISGEGEEKGMDGDEDVHRGGEGEGEGAFSDTAILDTAEGRVRGWIAIPLPLADNNAPDAVAADVGMMGDVVASLLKSNGGTPDSGYGSLGTTPAEAVMDGEIMKS